MSWRQSQSLPVVILFSALVIVVIIAVLSLSRLARPRYFAVKMGMSSDEVHVIVRAGYDSYPNPAGGWTSYYHSSEGTIVVTFDSDGRAIKKTLQ